MKILRARALRLLQQYKSLMLRVRMTNNYICTMKTTAQNVQDFKKVRETQRLILCVDEGDGYRQFFTEGRTSPKQCAQSGGLLWATENMQTQGPKTIGHMNTYISMLDFTSVPAWIILYCFTAGGCFICLFCKFFLVVFSTGFFQDPGMDLSVFTHAAPLAG